MKAVHSRGGAVQAPAIALVQDGFDPLRDGRRPQAPNELTAAAGAWAAALAALCRIVPPDDEERLLAEAERRRILYLEAKSRTTAGDGTTAADAPPG